MNDQNKIVSENQRIDEMERRVEPLAIMFLVLIVMLILSAAADAYAIYLYKSQIDNDKALTSALNGQAVDTGESIIRCQVVDSQLVPGLARPNKKLKESESTL